MELNQTLLTRALEVLGHLHEDGLWRWIEVPGRGPDDFAKHLAEVYEELKDDRPLLRLI